MFKVRMLLSMLVGFLGLALTQAASAAVDVSAVTTAITDASTAIGTVGAAVLVLIVGYKVFKWIQRAL